MRKVGMGVEQNGKDLAAENAKLKKANTDLAAENAKLKKALKKSEQKNKADAGEQKGADDAEGKNSAEVDAPVGE